MTEPEFHEWLAFHAARFPSLASWLGKVPDRPARGMPSRGDILGAWFDTLRTLPLDAAKDASRLMHVQPDVEQPKAADRHPAMILAIARKARASVATPAWQPRRNVDGHETYACPTCRDTGAVSVFSAETIRRVKAGRDKPIVTEAARCACEAACRNWPPLAYDPARMIRVDPLRMEHEQLDDVRAWTPAVVLTPGRYSEFDAVS
jgi:hypothetical protein